MNSSFLGSYSKQMFVDLLQLNVSSQHTRLHVYEMMDREIINTTVFDLDDTQDIVEDIKTMKRLKNSSYLLGLLVDDTVAINERFSDSHSQVTMIDTQNDRSLSYCIERNKEFMHVCVSRDVLGVQLGKNQKLYVDEFNSISETPMSGYTEITTPNIYYLNIKNIKND